jgi:ribonucleotide reductase beta subunit family protein with ferritin-like domain
MNTEKLRMESLVIKTIDEDVAVDYSKGIQSIESKTLLTDEDAERFVVFPVKQPALFQMYQKHLSVFWIPEEVSLTKDVEDYANKLTTNERYFINRILGFFAGSDGIVMENLALRFMREVPHTEAKLFYGVQNMMEGVHSVMYSLLIDTYIKDREEKRNMLGAITRIPCVQKKAAWALQWIDSVEADFPTRLLAFAIVEGIFFSGAFCAIFWLKQRAIMPGLTTSNEFISRDEGLHTDFACLLYGMQENKLTKAKAYRLVKEAVKIEKEFIIESLPCALVGMNSKQMSQYIEFVADRLLVQLGYPKAFDSANPFPFMERISLEGKDNFFEKRVTNYAVSGVGKTDEEQSFGLDADF